MTSTETKIQELIEDFNQFDVQNRLLLLLEFSDNLPDLPERYRDHPDLLERVEECQSPVFLFVEVDEHRIVHLYVSAPREAPTTRGFASILHQVLDGQAVNDVLAVDDDFPGRLGLDEAVSALRMRGIRAMLYRIKRQVSEKST